jgi:hypothetical protein
MDSAAKPPVPIPPSVPENAGLNPAFQKITFEQGERIIAALREHGAAANCPRCGNEHFTLLPGIVAMVLQAPGPNVALAGPSLPCATIYCTRCGFVSSHALGMLGFMDEKGNVTL